MCIISTSYWPTVTKFARRCIWCGCTDWQIHPGFTYSPQSQRSKCTKQMSGNYSGTNRNPGTQTLIVLRGQNEPSSYIKTGPVWSTLWVKVGCRNKVGVNRHFQARCRPLQNMGCLLNLDTFLLNVAINSSWRFRVMVRVNARSVWAVGIEII